MASNEDKKDATTEQQNHKDTKYRIENPFISFRRFADEKIGSALQSIVGLPSAVTKQFEGISPGLESSRNQTARDRGETESSRSKFGRNHHPERPQGDSLNSDDQAPQSLIGDLKTRREEHRKKWKHIREAIQQGPDATYTPTMGNVESNPSTPGARQPGFPRCPPNDRNGETDYQRSAPPTLPKPPIFIVMDSILKDLGQFSGTANLGPLGASLFSSLNTVISPDSFLPYLIFSPYSPLFLSNPSDKHFADFPYCDAFEDLLLASRGMEMVSLEERRKRQIALPKYPARSYDIGLAAHWVSRLQSRGLLEGSPRMDEHLDYEDDGTELAMYKRFLSSAFPKTAVEIPEAQKVLPEAQKLMPEAQKEAPRAAIPKNDDFDRQEAPLKDGVLSTLTRTESKRFPDGRIETKVVLIKRFADGGETRTETVHSNYEGSELDQRKLEDRKQIAPGEKKDEEKKGWFWN